ncbi:VOC family protein [Fictibacillus fluitans]|uniref:VOC family protein n=1 Tax=Fictibacillus fluitans TaxID=3058422 RepID=UPI003CD0D72A
MIPILGINHLTLTVNSLMRSLSFYVDVLGAVLVHRGRTDAYIEWGPVWICLLERGEANRAEAGRAGMDHVAFTISDSDFDHAVEALKAHSVRMIRGPVARGDGRCVNFLDPDGIQLELNTGSLSGRMKDWR